MRHRKTSRREACTGQKEQGRGEVKRGAGEGERREVEARAVVGRCERREGEAGEGGGDSCRAITVVEVQTSREFERRPVAVRASYASRHGCIVSRDTEVKTRTRIIFIT